MRQPPQISDRLQAIFHIGLPGTTSDLLLASVSSIAIGVFGLAGLPRRLLEIFILILLLSIAFEARVYLRTDWYFALQEALRTKNLYQDGWRYVRDLARALARRSTSSGPVSRAVRLYAWFMVPASLIMLWQYVLYVAPVTIRLFATSGRNLVTGWHTGNRVDMADGLIVILIEGSLLLAFGYAALRKHFRTDGPPSRQPDPR